LTYCGAKFPGKTQSCATVLRLLVDQFGPGDPRFLAMFAAAGLIYSAKILFFPSMRDHRLGDVIDDHCIKCRRITNHAIVSLLGSAPAKVRCRTCYHDHDYRNEQAPPSKKDLKKAELFKEVLAAANPSGAEADPEPELAVEVQPETPANAAKSTKVRAKKA
jgi:hypothetical protein